MHDIYRLGILSDTHITDLATAVELAEKLLKGPFANVDAILHAGDIILPEFESCFKDISFYAVQGNMDEARLGLPSKRILEFSGHRTGLIHGWGPASRVAQNVLTAFETERLDLLVFGHSHTPFLRFVGQTLLFNPGSAMDHRGNANCCSVGLVEFGVTINAVHIPFELSAEIY